MRMANDERAKNSRGLPEVRDANARDDEDVMGAVFITNFFLTCAEAKKAQAEGVVSSPHNFIRFKMSDSEHRIVKITLPDETHIFCRESELRRAMMECMK